MLRIEGISTISVVMEPMTKAQVLRKQEHRQQQQQQKSQERLSQSPDNDVVPSHLLLPMQHMLLF